MKKILLLTTIFLFTFNSFAQKTSFDENITKLMYAKNGMGGVENITKKLTKNIAGKSKIEFTNALNKLKSDFISDTKNQFKNEYTNEQIIIIYDEFHSDIINRSDLHNNFFSKFRKAKGLFFKDVKQMYYKYLE